MICKDGFSYSFDDSACQKCGGRCCTGESGYIWISQMEIEALANHLKVATEVAKNKFLEPVGARWSIKEKPFNGGFACLFFDEKISKCKIYECRPKQCRSFPFWDYFKNRLDELKAECPGVISGDGDDKRSKNEV